jgi:acyl carrier protein
MSPDITGQLTQYIVKDILKQPKRQINADTPLISNGMIDSFHLVDLALFVEEKFGVRIDDSELNKDCFDTVDQLVTLIQQRQAEQAG